MGRATGGVRGMKFRDGDSLLSMSVIRAAQVAAEEAAEHRAEEAGESTEPGDLPDVKEQYVFTITDGGFAKRSRISEYRLQSRGGIGIKAMSLANEDRGGLVGAFIVEEDDEVLSITSGGQVVRSPIDANFRPTGRSTMGVKFVSPKSGDTVAVVARSVEAKVAEEVEEQASEAAEDVDAGAREAAAESPDVVDGATIEGQDAVEASTETPTRPPRSDPCRTAPRLPVVRRQPSPPAGRSPNACRTRCPAPPRSTAPTPVPGPARRAGAPGRPGASPGAPGCG